MSRASELGARLAHDVGKYIARTAHNLLPSGTVSTGLRQMLIEDLYALKAGRRASEVFGELALPLAELGGDRDGRLSRARALLAEADGLEGAIRAGEGTAVLRGAALALEVERLLHELRASLGRG